MSGDDALRYVLRGALADAFQSREVREVLRELLREELGTAPERQPADGDGDPLMTVAEAARYAGVTEATIRDWISRGQLGNPRRAGNRWRLHRSDLEQAMRPPGEERKRVDIDAVAGQLVSLDRARRRK